MLLVIVKFFLTIIVNVKGVTLYGLVKSLYTFPYSTDYIFILRCLNEHSLHIFMFLLIFAKVFEVVLPHEHLHTSLNLGVFKVLS